LALVAAGLLVHNDSVFAAVGGIVEYPVPTSSSYPIRIAAGPDGNMWFTEDNANKVAYVTSAGVFNEFPTGSTQYALPWAIAAGPDGNLWFTEVNANSVGKVTTSGVFTYYPVPSGSPSDIVAGPDGNLWLTEPNVNKVAKVTTSGVFTEYSVITLGSGPGDIAGGPDGNLWVTEQSGNKVARVTVSGVVTEYPIPTSNSNPGGIVAGPDGRLWFTERNGNKVAKVTTSGVFTEYSVPTVSSSPNGIAAGPDGNLWFTEYSGNNVAEVTTSGVFTEYSIPTAGSHPEGIVAGPGGKVWFTEGSANKVAEIPTTTAATTTVIASSSNPSAVAQGVTYTATVAPTPDGGTVAFIDNGTTLSGCGAVGVNTATGKATCATSYSVVGTHAIVASYGGDANFGTSNGSLTQYVNAAVSAMAVLPAMSNGAYGGYTTAATIQNIGTGSATVRIDYFDQNGAPVGVGDLISALPMNASWTVRQDNGNSFPSTGGDAARAGSAVVSSSQPVASFVNEFAPGNVGDATSYSGVQVPSGVGTTLYAPTIVNNAYGGYTTGIGLLNEGSSPSDVTITYRDGSGAVAKTQMVTALAAHAYHALYSGDAVLALPSGFAGTATITSSAGQPLGAVVNETGPGGQFSSYDAVPSGSTTLNAPVALNNAFGGYYTGMGIQNTTGTAGAVMVTYYDASGTPTVKSFLITANGSLGVYQGSPTDGPAVGAYTATITSSVAIAAIVNEVASSSTSAQQSTSYNTFSAGSATLHLPLVENAGSDPWNTGEGIMNTGTASTTVAVNYYNADTGAAVGSPLALTLAPHAFWGLYQPTGGLPSGTRATAVITNPFGGQVAVICNESSTTAFMSYDGQ
jgi:virginiamycin B lyase